MPVPQKPKDRSMTAAANSLIADGETFKTVDSTPRGVGESPVWDAGQ